MIQGSFIFIRVYLRKIKVPSSTINCYNHKYVGIFPQCSSIQKCSLVSRILGYLCFSNSDICILQIYQFWYTLHANVPIYLQDACKNNKNATIRDFLLQSNFRANHLCKSSFAFCANITNAKYNRIVHFALRQQPNYFMQI